MSIIRKEGGSSKGKVDRVIGYSPSKNIVIPIFEDLLMEEFKKGYPERIAVVASQLAQDEDFTPDTNEEVEI